MNHEAQLTGLIKTFSTKQELDQFMNTAALFRRIEQAIRPERILPSRKSTDEKKNPTKK